MIKNCILIIFVFGLITCKQSMEPVEYLGQIKPDSIPIIFAPDIVSMKGRLEHGISFTPDMQEIAFGLLDKENFSGEILYSKNINKTWTETAVFEPLRGKSAFLPYFSPDGKSMLYTQSGPDNNFVTDIWILNKNNGVWEHPEKVNSPISSLSRESTACMTLNNKIYFSSNRDGNGLADLYFSPLDNGEYSKVKRIDSICSERDEESIFVSPEENYIIFSRYTTDENGPDLFISYQDSKRNWTEPILLDSTINTKEWERRPFVSIDNKFLFFTKLTMNQLGIAESDIYWVNTQKVFKPYVFNPIIEKIIKIGKETELTIPLDYFKSVNNQKLEIRLNNEKAEWAKFDKEKKILVMNPNKIGEFDLIFTAVDKFSNKTNHRVKITVEK